MNRVSKIYSIALASAAIILFLIFFLSSASAASHKITETRITTNGSDQVNPAIYGDRIVWQDSRNGNYDIYMYDLSTSRETRITTNGSDQVNPAIYGDRIVWQDERNGNDDIYMYDISASREIQITTNESNQQVPAIYGDIIAWQDFRNGNFDIYVYDLSTRQETQITTNETWQTNPVIYGDRIVWNGWFDEFYNSEIYMYNLTTSTETRITNDEEDPDNEYHYTYTQWNAAIYGDKIVYERGKEEDLDPHRAICMYDLSASEETLITPTGINHEQPAIYGNRIVWKDYRDTDLPYGSGYIYMYDLSTSTETKITELMSGESPVIYGDKIVWADIRNGDSDIYMCTISGDGLTPEPPVANFSASPTSGNAPLEVTFTDKSTGYPNSWNWVFGDGGYSTYRNPEHTYNKAGTYVVSLTASNEDGATSKTLKIIVQEAKVLPVANFRTNVSEGYAPLSVLFTDLSQNATSRTWDFNNDGTVDSKALNPVYVYTSPGEYTVNMTAGNENGTNSKTASITVLKGSSNNESSDNESGSGDLSEDSQSSGSYPSSGGSSGGTGGSSKPETRAAEPGQIVKTGNMSDSADAIESNMSGQAAAENETAPGFDIISGVVCLFCLIFYKIKEK